MLTLYTTPLSANGRKALAVARHLDIVLDERFINVYAGEGQDEHYLSINPWGKIPTLVEDELILWESNAILVHLSENHSNFELSSSDARTRADILRWLFWESSHWQPVLSRVLASHVEQVLLQNSNNVSNQTNWEDSELIGVLTYLESVLATKNFICGDELTIADFSVAGMTTYFRACGFPFTHYPAISMWLGQFSHLSAWVSTEEALWS